jgi:hypothetical protein
MPDHRRALLRLRDAQLVRFQPAYFIAKAPCFLELQIGGCLAHAPL